jgi:hypothetical protein
MDYFIKEIKHIQDHWLSCLLTCIVVHIGLELGGWAFQQVLWFARFLLTGQT